jgi:hypothetical protein
LTVAGQDVDVAGGEVTVAAGTRAVSVVAVTTDPFASYTVAGNEELVAGESNSVTVTVTAANGDTAEVVVTVVVPAVVLGEDASLESLTVAGQDVDVAGGEVTVAAGTRAVSVVAVTTDPFASYTVEGNQELVDGANTVTVTVTAANGETERIYEVAVTVTDLQLLDDVSLAMFLVNGIDALENDAIELPYGTTRVNVKVETTEATSSYIVVGDGRLKPLVPGENELILTVTAANGDSENYSVILTVLDISTNNSLDPDGGLFVDGEAVDLEILDSTSFVNVPLNTTLVRVLAKAEDATADVIANGKNMLPSSTRAFAVEKGINEIAIQVIPEAGNSYAKTYKLKVYVGGADTTLKTVKVNATTITIGVDGSGNLQTPLPAGTKTATMYIEPTVAEAVGLGNGTKVELDGGDVIATRSNVANTWNLSGLVGGENTISITVTPGDANAEQGSYSIAIPVAVSSDTRLKTFTVNGAKVTPGIPITLKKFTTSVAIAATPEDALATVEVSGGDGLVPGFNTLTVTVTAEDGTTKDYEVRAVVPKDTKVAVVSFPKLGVVKFDKKSTPKGFDSLAKALKVVKGTVAIVKITDNFLIGKDKKTAGPLRAQNVKKYLASLKTNDFKNAIYLYGPDPKAKKAKGLVVTIYTY